MTSFWEVPSKLKHMLSDFEIYGMQGNRLVRPRYNILLDEITYEKKEDSRLIHGIPTCCEGASLNCTCMDVSHVFKTSILETGLQWFAM